MLSSTYQLWFSSTSMKPATSSRSTSVGDPSGLRHALAGDDQRADEAARDVADLVVVRVIHPERGAAFVRGRTGALGDFPRVGVRAAGRHRVVGLVGALGAVVVVGAFRILVVEDAVRVDRRRELRVVAEDDLDRVADLGADQRSEEAEVLPLGRPRLEGGEGRVRVLAVERLLRLAAGDVRPGLHPRLLERVERPAFGGVGAARRVVPDHLVRGDVVGAGDATAGRDEPGGRGRPDGADER